MLLPESASRLSLLNPTLYSRCAFLLLTSLIPTPQCAYCIIGFQQHAIDDRRWFQILYSARLEYLCTDDRKNRISSGSTAGVIPCPRFAIHPFGPSAVPDPKL